MEVAGIGTNAGTVLAALVLGAGLTGIPVGAAIGVRALAAALEQEWIVPSHE